MWVVEAKLKPGFRHIYSRRMMYWDEDGYSAGVGENYDAANKLYRVVSVISFPFFVEEGGGFFGEGNLQLRSADGRLVGDGPVRQSWRRGCQGRSNPSPRASSRPK